jgi:tyrosyl-tRNA synthetase
MQMEPRSCIGAFVLFHMRVDTCASHQKGDGRDSVSVVMFPISGSDDPKQSKRKMENVFFSARSSTFSNIYSKVKSVREKTLSKYLFFFIPRRSFSPLRKKKKLKNKKKYKMCVDRAITTISRNSIHNACTQYGRAEKTI